MASSTSGFAMTMLQADCAHPERCVVGHPFNPPYLIPLVEVVGGERTDPAAVDWLAAFYAAVGKRPLRLTRELPGFVGNRLQEAMWREALHMVAPARRRWPRSMRRSRTAPACAGRRWGPADLPPGRGQRRDGARA